MIKWLASLSIFGTIIIYLIKANHTKILKSIFKYINDFIKYKKYKKFHIFKMEKLKKENNNLKAENQLLTNKIQEKDKLIKKYENYNNSKPYKLWNGKF